MACCFGVGSAVHLWRLAQIFQTQARNRPDCTVYFPYISDVYVYLVQRSGYSCCWPFVAALPVPGELWRNKKQLANRSHVSGVLSNFFFKL